MHAKAMAETFAGGGFEGIRNACRIEGLTYAFVEFVWS